MLAEQTVQDRVKAYVVFRCNTSKCRPTIIIRFHEYVYWYGTLSSTQCLNCMKLLMVVRPFTIGAHGSQL